MTEDRIAIPNHDGSQPAEIIPKGNGKPLRFPLNSSGVIIGHMHRHKRPTQCVGLLYLKETTTVETIKDVIVSRMLAIPKMRCKLVMRPWTKSYYWEEVDVDLSYHFRVPFTTEVSKETLHEYLSKQNEEHLDINRPLWRITFIPKMEDGRPLIISDISHAVGDGIAQVELLFSLLDKESNANTLNRASSKEEERAIKNRTKSLKVKKRAKNKASLLDRLRMFGYGVVEGSLRSFMPRDPMNALRLKDPTNGTSPIKKMAEAKPIDIERVKDIKKRFSNATVNDILLGVLTLATKAALKEVGDKQATKNRISAQFPINMRSPKAKSAFRNGVPYNDFSYGKFNFPFKKKSRIQVVKACKRQADLQKVSPAPYMLLYSLKAALMLGPTWFSMRRGKALATQSTITISNVPGPQERVKLGGVEIDEMLFYLFAPLGLYFGVLSYAGYVNLSVNMDNQLPIEPQTLCDHWNREFDALEEEVKNLQGPL